MTRSRWHRRLFHLLEIHRHLLVSALFGVAIYMLLAGVLPREADILVGWNGAVILYMGWTLRTMRQVPHTLAAMQARAQYHDEGRGAVLFLSVTAAVLSLAAVVNELTVAREAEAMLPHLALAGGTVITSWLFVHFIFALHYAHIYYDAHQDGLCEGLDIPGHEPVPDYWDFLYFSFIIGTSAQTADININRRPMRRIALVHCVIAFFFNTTVLALTINAAAGLLG